MKNIYIFGYSTCYLYSFINRYSLTFTMHTYILWNDLTIYMFNRVIENDYIYGNDILIISKIHQTFQGEFKTN